jgi:hypothetical protein
MPHIVVRLASLRLGTLVVAILLRSSSCCIVALRKFGGKRWPFVITDEAGVLFLEPGKQANWTGSFVIIVHGD